MKSDKRELLKKLAELEGDVIKLKISDYEIRNALSIQKPTAIVEFYYAPKEVEEKVALEESNE